jgi:hypothetical protein
MLLFSSSEYSVMKEQYVHDNPHIFLYALLFSFVQFESQFELSYMKNKVID